MAGRRQGRDPAGGRSQGTREGELLLTEGPAGGPFTAPLALGGPASTFSFATAYLGDAALASLADPHGRMDVQLRVQRYYASAFAPPARGQRHGGARDGLDRSAHGRARLPLRQARRLLPARLPLRARAARQRRAARDSSGSGRALPPARGSRPSSATMTARSSPGPFATPGRRASTSPARSPAFASPAPQLLEEFPDPPGLPDYVDSPRIVRLSSESVMLAWTGAVAGHWAIRAAAIDLNGVLPPSTISPPGRDALLADLAPGPNDEALALWTEPLPDRRGPGPRRAGDLRRARVRRLPRTGQVRRPRTHRPAGAEQRRDRRLRSRQRPCGRGLAHRRGRARLRGPRARRALSAEGLPPDRVEGGGARDR